MSDFTGERVIPGQVDPDLWNEHVARYLFAARLSRAKLVLDLGCGTGYGSAILAAEASTVGLDSSTIAIEFARRNYAKPNLGFAVGTCNALPFRDAAVDLVVAFEVIEHLLDWASMLREARRVLKQRGHFVVSTPNKSYYATTRQHSGPNPFHEHEFEFDEFRESLSAVFPHVCLFVQNHAEGIVFQRVKAPEHPARIPDEAGLPTEDLSPEDSHFFVAVCALEPQTEPPGFIYVPSAGNLLAERERHIASLQAELVTKNEWLTKATQEHSDLVELHRSQTVQLEERNRWAEKLNDDIRVAKERVVQLQEELRVEHAAAAEVAAGYESKVAQLEEDCRVQASWAAETEHRLRQKCDELAQCVRLLDTAERTVEERTAWARTLELERHALADQLSLVEASRWIKLGRAFGLGPKLRNR